MSIETLPVANTILEELNESVEKQPLQSPTEAEAIVQLHQLQPRRAILASGLIGLTTQLNNAPTERLQPTFVAIAEEYCELIDTIKVLEKKYPNIAEVPKVTGVTESIIERRVRLHNESANFTNLLHKLEMHHTARTLSLIALASEVRSPHSTMTDEREMIAKTIANLREDHHTILRAITDCNQTVWRPNSDDEKDKAERKRIEQPYIIEIYNNGEDPTETAGLPAHLTGANYRYLTNAPI
jgi:hypothetical protein